MNKAALQGIVVSIAVGLTDACVGPASEQPYYPPLSGTAGTAASTATQSSVGAGGSAKGNGGTIGTAASGGRTIGTGGKATGGKGGSTTTTTTATGGKTTTGGKGGSATGGSAAKAGSGAGEGGGATSFFSKAYNSVCVGPGGGYGTNHYPSTDCLSCHRIRPPSMVFGGQIFQSNGSTGARNIEIGVKSGANFYSTCTTSAGGLFYAPSNTGTINWAGAEVGIRNAKGESRSMHKNLSLSGSCNAGGNCHGTEKLIEP